MKPLPALISMEQGRRVTQPGRHVFSTKPARVDNANGSRPAEPCLLRKISSARAEVPVKQTLEGSRGLLEAGSKSGQSNKISEVTLF